LANLEKKLECRRRQPLSGEYEMSQMDGQKKRNIGNFWRLSDEYTLV
jgi:hypothetical protein